MIFKRILSLVLIFPGILFSEQPDTLILAPNTVIRIDNILIEGNSSTEEFVILRELTFSAGDNVDQGILDFNRDRIFSLGLFNSVRMLPVERGDSLDLIIEVEETWYIYPIPFVNFKEKDFQQVSYGLYVLYKNFRGRNELLYAKIALGFDPHLQLIYNNPYLFQSADIGSYHELTYQNVGNKSQRAEEISGGEFDYKYISYQLGLTKRLGAFHQLRIFGGYEYWEMPDYFEGSLTASMSRIDRMPKAGLSYKYDTRDLIQYPVEGLFAESELQIKGLGFHNVSYNIFRLDFREYRKIIGELSSKWRIFYRHTFGGNVPFYDYSYLGYAEFVRGYASRRSEGNNLLKASWEIRYPIIGDFIFKLPFIVLSEKFSTARIALYLEIFGDTAVTYDNNQKVSLKQFQSGYGAGLTFLVLPYNALRIAYAFNEYRKGEILIGTGISF